MFEVDAKEIDVSGDEIWKPIDGYEDEYAVSNLGRVKRLKKSSNRRSYPAGTILKPRKQKNNYVTINLSNGLLRKTYYIHRLVAVAFIGKIPIKHEVNHINSIRDDNRLCNLEYVTRSGNNLHAYHKNGRLSYPSYGEDNYNWKVTDIEVMEIREKHAQGVSYAKLGRDYLCHWTSIRSIVKRETHQYVI